VLRVTALNDNPGDHEKFGQENLKGVVILFVTFTRYQGQIEKNQLGGQKQKHISNF